MTKTPVKPMFIVFEGIDGSGKTTQSQMLCAHFKASGLPVRWLREPSDTTIWGKKIRSLANKTVSIPPDEEVKYFIEDRKLDVQQNIKPALESGISIILDRYFFSNACYQGARGLDMAEILRRNREFAPEPDLVIVIDVDVEVALSRIKTNRGNKVPLFEQREFLEKVRKNYLSLPRKNLCIVNGNNSVEKVFNDILGIKKIEQYLLEVTV